MSKGGIKGYNRNRNKRRYQNNVILIICCGDTEVKYFEEFNLELGKIRLLTVKENCSPEVMVKIAIRKKNESTYRQIWCVFDKDEYFDFHKAICLAKENDIGVAYSNQAFEIWFIMHFKYIYGPINRDKYNSIINTCIKRKDNKKYEKPYIGIYKKLCSKTDKAIENAKIGHQMHIKNGGKPSDWESCTTVYKLVSELSKWKK